MEKAQQDQLIWYLNKNYYIKNNTFFELPDTRQWGKNIVKDISKFWDCELEMCEEVFKIWAHNMGFPHDDRVWNRSYIQQRLTAQYQQVLNPDYRAYLGVDWERKVMMGLYEVINKELESNFLKDSILKITTIEELLEIVKCEGYILGPSLYIFDTYNPKQSFMSITYDELLKERQNNVRWQNWLRGE